MPLVITHAFTSAVADGADATLVRPSNWNATHTLSGTLDVSQGGTGQTTEAEALGEMIQALTADGSPDLANDYLVTYDASADTGKKVLLNAVGIATPVAVASGGTGQTTEAEALGEMTQALTVDSAPDVTADYVATYDASADTGKKVLLTSLVRETLTANRTYYVRSDGSDSNTGLVNSAGGAFLTIQKAIEVWFMLDAGNAGAGGLGTYTVTVNVGAGTFAGFYIVGPPYNVPFLLIAGAGVASTTLTSRYDGFNASAAFVQGYGEFYGTSLRVKIQNVTMTSLGDGFGWRIVWLNGGAILTLTNCNLAIGTGDIGIQVFGGFLRTTGTWSVSGNAFEVIDLSDNALGLIAGTWTITGSPTWTTGVFNGFPGSFFSMYDQSNAVIGASFTGSATGRRYWINLDSRVVTPPQFTPTQSFFPGSTAGVVSADSSYMGIPGPSAVTFADLPGSTLVAQGMIYPITDSTTTTWGATITGGGANKVLAHYNGTNWTVAAV